MNPVGLVNLALDAINSRADIVTGIDPPVPPDNKAAQVASRSYQLQCDATFRAAHWNCARFQAELTLLKAARGTPENADGRLPEPDWPWHYAYAYPDDCLLVRFLMPHPKPAVGVSNVPLMTGSAMQRHRGPQTAMPFVPASDVDSDGNRIRVILTNARAASAVYTGRLKNPDLWDASLQNAVIAVLAAWMCIPLTGDKSLMTARVQLAVGIIQAARISDGNEGITSGDLPVDWMEARNAGTEFAMGPVPQLFASWAAIAMPNGISY